MIVFPLFSSNVQVNLHIYRLLESGRYDTQKDFTVKCHDNQHHHHHHRHRSSSPSSLLFSTMLIVQSSFIKVLFNRWWSSHPSSTARFPRSSTNSSKGGFIISTSFISRNINRKRIESSSSLWQSHHQWEYIAAAWLAFGRASGLGTWLHHDRHQHRYHFIITWSSQYYHHIIIISTNLTNRYLPDLSYLAPDCFHFSQKLHALSKKELIINQDDHCPLKTTNKS